MADLDLTVRLLRARVWAVRQLRAAAESAGRWREAIPLLERDLADRVQALGENHPDTLTARNRLAGAYESAGRQGGRARRSRRLKL